MPLSGVSWYLVGILCTGLCTGLADDERGCWLRKEKTTRRRDKHLINQKQNFTYQKFSLSIISTQTSPARRCARTLSHNAHQRVFCWGAHTMVPFTISLMNSIIASLGTHWGVSGCPLRHEMHSFVERRSPMPSHHFDGTGDIGK